MPRLLKKIEAEIISLFGDANSNDFTAPVYLLQSVVGNAGIEDYIELTTFTALTQDFSSVGGGGFCETTPTQHGLSKCSSYEDLNISY
jgi:hypothetical protein